MQNVFVEQLNIAYLGEVLSRYLGGCGYLVLYFAALIFIVIKGNDKEKKVFLPLSLMMFATVYNPVFPIILNKFADINNEYYRFFWITPIVVLVPICFVKLIEELRAKNILKAPAVLLIVLIIATSSRSVYKDGFKLSENIYKVPDELMEVSKIIHEDSKEEYSKAFLEYDYNMMMRQYDPKMLLTIDREDYLQAVSEDYSYEMIYDEANPQYRLLAALVRYQNVDMNWLFMGLEQTDTEYVVLTTGSTMIPKLESRGLRIIGKTKNHTILKADLENHEPYELVDYSGVYRDGL